MPMRNTSSTPPCRCGRQIFRVARHTATIQSGASTQCAPAGPSAAAAAARSIDCLAGETPLWCAARPGMLPGADAFAAGPPDPAAGVVPFPTPAASLSLYRLGAVSARALFPPPPLPPSAPPSCMLCRRNRENTLTSTTDASDPTGRGTGSWILLRACSSEPGSSGASGTAPGTTTSELRPPGACSLPLSTAFDARSSFPVSVRSAGSIRACVCRSVWIALHQAAPAHRTPWPR